MIKIQVICSAIMTKEQKDELMWLIDNDRNLDIIRFDPSIIRGINFGIADGLLMQQNGKIKLKDRGIELVELINKESEMFIEERMFLNLLGYRLTEKIIDDTRKQWGRR